MMVLVTYTDNKTEHFFEVEGYEVGQSTVLLRFGSGNNTRHRQVVLSMVNTRTVEFMDEPG